MKLGTYFLEHPVYNCRNNHEIIQLFLSRGHVVHHPHPIYCECSDCQHRQTTDSLKRSLSRLNAYKALSSPAYMALSSVDPITTTFELRQEMMQVAEVEKEFKVGQGQTSSIHHDISITVQTDVLLLLITFLLFTVCIIFCFYYSMGLCLK